MGAAISDTLRQNKEVNSRLPQLHPSFCLHLKPAWIHPKSLRCHGQLNKPPKLHCSVNLLFTKKCLPHLKSTLLLPAWSQRSQHQAPRCSYGYVWLLTFEILALFWSALSLCESSVNWDWSRWFILRVRILHCHTDNVTCLVYDIAGVCLKVGQKPERSGEWTGDISKVP